MTEKLFLTLAIGFGLISCGSEEQTSDLKAMSSKDWFKSGVDRLYLAYEQTGIKISANYPNTTGESHIIGIACYGESKDPNSIVPVPVRPGASETENLPLSERTMIHQFPIVERGNLVKGQCRKVFDNNYGKLKNIFTDASRLNYDFRDGIVKVGITCGATAVSALTRLSTKGATDMFLIGPSGVVTDLALAYACYQTTFEIPAMIDMDRNKQILAKAHRVAGEVAEEKLKKSGKWKTYRDLVGNSSTREIGIAMYSKSFVESFNSMIDINFENGWGKSAKFFESVEQIGKVRENLLSPIYEKINEYHENNETVPNLILRNYL